jgi:dihydrofolate reductase
MIFDLVVAADLDGGIGRANGLPWPRLAGDLAHFKAVTSTATAGQRNAVVMGRRTWESVEVAGRALPRRLNVVISRRPLVVPAGVLAATSLDDAVAQVAAAGDVDQCFVVGGAEIFRLALDDARLRFVYLTRVEGRFGCDTFLPPLDEAWSEGPWDGARELEDGGVRYRIARLVRRRPGT